MSGLGLLATAFGSYASTLGGLYKEQVEKEQAAQEKLAAEERQREWDREKMASERQFAIDMLQRKFDYDVKLKSMENEWEARNAAIAHQRALEKEAYKYELWKKERDYAAQVERRDDMVRGAIARGFGKGVGDTVDPKLAVEALSKQLVTITKLLENAGEEEKEALLNDYYAVRQALNNILGLGNVGGSPRKDPLAIVGQYANRPE